MPNDDAVAGLTGDEAARRLATDGPNELPSAAPRNIVRQARDLLSEPMLLLLVAAGTVNFLLAEALDGSILMATVVIVIGISLYQEHKTETALVALRDLSSPRALVVRDGTPIRIAGRDVVRGDLVILAEGDRVPADAVVVEAAHLTIDESTLTGESVAVTKRARTTDDEPSGRPGGDGTPWIYSGTLVVRGRGAALVVATGGRSELGRIGTALRSIPTERSRLQREIDRLVRVIAVVGGAAAMGVVIAYGTIRGGWLEALLAGIATAMSLLPEEFPVVLVVFLALGAWRMSQRRVLARRAAAIETLGSVTVLCVDKTGTLTANEMTVNDLVVEGVAHPVTAGPIPASHQRLLEHAVLASPRSAHDPMDLAFRRLGDGHLGGAHERWELVHEYPLSTSILAVGNVWRIDGLEHLMVAVKGAPEAVATLCHLGETDAAMLLTQVHGPASRGERILGVAGSTWPADEPLPSDLSGFQLELLGLATLHDPVRPGVADAVGECARAGIRTVMITGDYPATALAIADEVGIDHRGRCVTGIDLDTFSDVELAGHVGDVSVFARMVPEQKLRLVRALQARGEVVGMTGDGVNDAPALRAADIGIAMGARGTDVARESAALVITDDDFTSIVGGIRQGRGIFDNLRKAMAYLVAIHVVVFGTALFPVFVADWPLILLPLQIALIELVIDPTCSVVFEAEQTDPRIMDHPPRRVGAPILDRRVLVVSILQGIGVFAAVAGVYLWAIAIHRTDAQVRSLTFATLVFGNLGLLLVNRSWRLGAWRSIVERRNPTLKWILLITTSLLTLLLTVPALQRAFDFGSIDAADAIVPLSAALAGVVWFEIYKKLAHRQEMTTT